MAYFSHPLTQESDDGPRINERGSVGLEEADLASWQEWIIGGGVLPAGVGIDGEFSVLGKRKLDGMVHQAARKIKAEAGREKGSAEAVATFVQVPVPERRGLSWIEIVAADGTQIRLPHRNLDALQVTLAALAGQASALR